jgi:ribosomal protein L11 methyltransferase
MAFGTGDHPSTRGAGRLLEQTVRPGHVVADLGAGSAVLAIAAARLGAAAVHAIEIDPEALDNARENIAANGAGEVVMLLEGDAAAMLPVIAPVDVIVANILSSVLVPMLPAMRAAMRAGGRAILAGMLIEERDAVSKEIEAGRWRIDAGDVEEAWWSVRIATS